MYVLLLDLDNSGDGSAPSPSGFSAMSTTICEFSELEIIISGTTALELFIFLDGSRVEPCKGSANFSKLIINDFLHIQFSQNFKAW